LLIEVLSNKIKITVKMGAIYMLMIENRKIMINKLNIIWRINLYVMAIVKWKKMCFMEMLGINKKIYKKVISRNRVIYCIKYNKIMLIITTILTKKIELISSISYKKLQIIKNK
jgi:hypothetical protein